MKRRNFLLALWIMSPLVFSSCKKDELPSTSTIITGKVIDENDKPVEGFVLQFGGYFQKGTSSIPTFDLDDKTNKDGTYKISYLVKTSDKQTYFKPIGDYSNNLFSQYDIYVWKDNKYQFVGNPVGPIIYGQINIFNFQIRKR